jgi:DNA-binding CsgD family transcriptional regulator
LLQAVRFDTSLWSLVQSKYSSPDTNRFIGLTMAARPGQIIWPRMLMSQQEWVQDCHYREFLDPQGFSDGLTGPLIQHADGFAAIAAFRGKHYDSRNVKLLESCMPHLRRALQVSIQVGTLQSRLDTAMAAIDNISLGVIFADRFARTLHANRAAQEILADCDGLSLGKGGALIAARPGDSAKLRGLIANASRAAIRGHDSTQDDDGGAIRLERPSGNMSLSVLVAPLRRAACSDVGLQLRTASALLLVYDPKRRRRLRAELISRLHGLTLAEAELVVQLFGNAELRTAAEAMGVTVNTAKTLLQRAFERTNTRRQSELLGLVLGGPAGFAKTESAK